MDESPILVWLPQDVIDEYQNRCRLFPNVPSHVLFREMARDGVL